MDIQTILELKAERANLTTEIRAHIDTLKDKEPGAEDRAKLEAMEKRFDTLNGRIQTEERQLERERLAGETGKRIEEERKSEDNGVKELRAKFSKCLREWDSGSIAEYRALQQDSPTQASYLVAPQQFVGEIIQSKDDALFMRRMARKFRLTSAQSMGFPKRTTRMSTFAWGTEIQAPTADSALAFGKREFIPKPGTGGILVSKTLTRNSAIDIQTYIRAEMGYNFAINEEQALLTGSGAGQPLGVFTQSDDGISTSRDVSTGNTVSEIKTDGLLEAKFSIKAPYWPRLEWIFHRAGVKQIAKLKDSDGQYIWQQSLLAGQPDRLLGFPVNMSEYAPSTFTTGLLVGILGDFNYYWIVDSLAMEMQALMELYALTNQIFYIAREEMDGMPVLEEAFARVKLA